MRYDTDKPFLHVYKNPGCGKFGLVGYFNVPAINSLGLSDRNGVFVVDGGFLKFRFSTIDDKRTTKLNRAGFFSFLVNADEGFYSIEKDGDWFYFEPMEEPAKLPGHQRY